MNETQQVKSNIPTWISVQEACNLLNVKEKTIKNRCYSHFVKIEFLPLAKTYIITNKNGILYLLKNVMSSFFYKKIHL